MSKTSDHKTSCRRQARKRDKLGHRLSSLAKIDWSEQTKEEVKAALTLEYTSSDESSYEQDSDTEVPQLQCYQVKHLKWERARVTTIKQSLDEVYMKSLPKRIRQSLVRRVQHTVDSERELPSNELEWAMRRPAPAGRVLPLSRRSAVSASSASSVSSRSLSSPFEDRVLDPIHHSTPRRSRQN